MSVLTDRAIELLHTLKADGATIDCYDVDDVEDINNAVYLDIKIKVVFDDTPETNA